MLLEILPCFLSVSSCSPGKAPQPPVLEIPYWLHTRVLPSSVPKLLLYWHINPEAVQFIQMLTTPILINRMSYTHGCPLGSPSLTFLKFNMSWIFCKHLLSHPIFSISENCNFVHPVAQLKTPVRTLNSLIFHYIFHPVLLKILSVPLKHSHNPIMSNYLQFHHYSQNHFHLIPSILQKW